MVMSTMILPCQFGSALATSVGSFYVGRLLDLYLQATGILSNIILLRLNQDITRQYWFSTEIQPLI